MLTTQFLIHILDALKKRLLRVARRSASLLFRFLSLVCRRFAAGHPNIGGWGLATRNNLSGDLPRSQSQSAIARGSAPDCYSLLPTDETVQEITQEPQFHSDDPYSLRPASAGEADQFKPSSMSSGHRFLQVGDNSVNGFLEGPLQNSSNSGPLSPPGPDVLPGSHLRQGDMDDTHPAAPSPTLHMRQILLAPPGRSTSSGLSRSIAWLSDISTSSSLARSIAGSEGRQIEYRTHKGPAHPVVDLNLDRHDRYTVPALPDDDEGPGSEVILYDAPPIAAMNPNDVRWQSHDLLPVNTPKTIIHTRTIVPGMTVVFPAHDAVVPENWIKLVHPAGARYFVNKEKRTFTAMNICDEEICGDIEYYMEYLLNELQLAVENGNLELDMQQVDLVLEPKVYGGESLVCCYYFANHRDRCLFWLDDYDVKDIISDCKRVENLSHIGLAIQAEYWKHWRRFPSMCPVAQHLVDEVKYMLLRATGDHLNSRVSVAPFDVVELRDYISIVDKITVHPHAGHGAQTYQSHVATILGQIMYTFSRNHFINSYGEAQARLDLKQKVHSYTPSPLMVVLAPLLFLEPMTQVRKLHYTFVDAMPSSERSNAFNLELNKQLQETSLLATVLLNANVGFLAINSVDVGGRSPAQIASYMSLVASFGSILLGLLLSHNQIMDQSQARIFLRDHLETLAMIHSFPKALLMWGMVFFFAAFSIHWATRGNASSGTIVGTVILVTLLMILYSITRTRNGENRSTLKGSA